MKHTFLIDENVLFFGMRGINRHNEEDFSSTTFLLMVALNCHRIVIDKELNKRIKKHLETLLRQRTIKPIPYYDLFLTTLVNNSEKFIRDFREVPPLPDEEKILRHIREDIHIVRAANHFNVPIVTDDEELRDFIRNNNLLKDIGIIALETKEAINLAKEK